MGRVSAFSAGPAPVRFFTQEQQMQRRRRKLPEKKEPRDYTGDLIFAVLCLLAYVIMAWPRG